MSRRLKFFVFIIGAAAGAIIAIMLLSKGRGTGSVETGPEDTLESFCKAMAEGEFERAMQFCDTLTMKEHVLEYHQAWNAMQEKDSSALAIASEMLENARIVIKQMTKDGNTREVHYTIEVGDVIIKKAASMRKEEGEWKIERIIDKN